MFVELEVEKAMDYTCPHEQRQMPAPTSVARSLTAQTPHASAWRNRTGSLCRQAGEMEQDRHHQDQTEGQIEILQPECAVRLLSFVLLCSRVLLSSVQSISDSHTVITLVVEECASGHGSVPEPARPNACARCQDKEGTARLKAFFRRTVRWNDCCRSRSLLLGSDLCR